MRLRVCTFALLLAAACNSRSATTNALRDANAQQDLATPSRMDRDGGVHASAQGYVGAAACGECHGKKRAAWAKSWHARALMRGDERGAVVGDFHGAHFRGSSSEAWMRTRGDKPVMRTRGPDGELAEFGIEWVIGGKRMQDAVTIFGDGRWQVLPVYFQVTQKKWVDYTETKQGPLGPDHPFYWTNFRRMANRECLDCHVSGLEVRFDRATRHWATGFVDAGVACEDCHGPGAKHADSTAPADIFSPKKASKELALDACAQCHGPRNPLFPLFDADHRFRPGQRYEDFYDPVVVLIGGNMSGDFFADGRPKVSSFEYQAMLQSACYRKGGATCLTCHTAPHEQHGADELRAAGDESCRGCHAAVFAAGQAHTRHKAAAAQSCIACHMPKVVSGVLDKFADHAIDVPVPVNTAKHGVPNACGTCHAQPKAWPVPLVRGARRERLADAFDRETAPKSEKALLEVIADGGEAASLRGAAALLLAQRFAGSAGALVPLLGARETLVRQKACEALGVAHARPAADALWARSRGDQALAVRQAAALALAGLGDERAEGELARLAGDPASAHLMQPHFALGRIYARRGDFAAAQRQFREVAQLTPYFADALLMLADVTARLGDLDGARSWVDDVLALDAGNAAAKQLRLRLEPER